MEKKPVMLMILDGFGINEKTDGNAVKLANTPNIDKLMKKYQTTKIYTSGLKVGLPDDIAHLLLSSALETLS